MKVLALATYPIEAAATRFRLAQFVGPLAERGIELDVRPFLDASQFARLYGRSSRARTAAGLARSLLRRCRDVAAGPRYDAIIVQREAMLLGPPVVEYALGRLLRRPIVLDLDDATYLQYESPTHGRLASALKWFGKTDDLIRWARVVTCGNSSIADYVGRHGKPTVIIPTVVDTEQFRPRATPAASEPPMLGWVGSHSTFPYLESIFPALETLARDRPVRLKVVGSGREAVRLAGVEVECLEWHLGREVEDFQSIDIGLYPLPEQEWASGKSGFKSIQYMAVGIPFVVSPVGACAEIGEPDVTHLAASSTADWVQALNVLLSDPSLRRQMGDAGRRHSLAHYTVATQADRLAAVLRGLLTEKRPGPD